MAKYPEEYIQKISEKVYRDLLAQSAGGLDAAWRAGEADRMIAKDGDGGKKFGRRAQAYSHLVRATLAAVGEVGDAG